MFIALAMTFTFVMSAPVYAVENSALKPPNNSDITPQQKTIEEQLEAYLAQPDKTPEQKQAATKKAELAQSLTNSAGFPKTYSTRAPAKALAVPFFSQENNHYCGPATVKQTVHYLLGESPQQDDIAATLDTNETGTDTNNICDYLNENTAPYYTVLWSWADANVLSQMVTSDIDNNQPIVAHVIIRSTTYWPYTTSGHYMNYNGYASNGATIYVTDPFADRYGYSTGKYSVSNVGAESVTDRIVW